MSLRLVVTLLLLFLSLMPGVGAEGRRAPPFEPANIYAFAQSNEPTCEIFCSDVRPGTIVAEISWEVSASPLSSGTLRTRLARQSLDVTVYKGGFERGLFATVAPVAGEQRFRLRRPGTFALERAPGLDRLVVTDVSGSAKRPDRGGSRRESPDTTRLDATRPTIRGLKFALVKIEGLEPGLNYFWRVSSPTGGRRALSRVVRCQAPACPADFRPDAARP